MQTIRHLNFNWRMVDGREEFDSRSIGTKYGGVECVRIEEHEARGDGDRFYYDIYYADHTRDRVFNPNAVFFGDGKPPAVPVV